MKVFEGSATGTAAAPLERCFEQLADLESYPQWYPETVRSMTVTARDEDGKPAAVAAALTFAYGPLKFNHDLPLTLALDEPRTVLLQRLADDEHDSEQFQVRWQLEAVDAESTSLEVKLHATLNLPAFLPDAIADEVARGFLVAAQRSLGS
jgi:ribosome-associated toxin RatA of RatAB toxin-antitoxin module